MADLLAELAGYKDELDNYERAGREDRAAQVRAQVDRVTGQIRGEVDKLHARADNHEDAGQDLLAAQARVEAKRLARALPDEPPKASRGRVRGKETAQDTSPKERA